MLNRDQVHSVVDAFLDNADRLDVSAEMSVTAGSDVIEDETAASGNVTRCLNGTLTLTLTINGGAKDGTRPTREAPST